MAPGRRPSELLSSTLVGAGTVFLMYVGQLILTPLIAPLARELQLAEWQIGVVASTAALVMVIASPVWGRYGRRWGRRRVLLATTASATLAIAAFAFSAKLGLDGVLGAGGLFLTFLLVRGLWFGVSEAAIVPNVQAYIAETTPDPDSRVRGMAALGAAQGAALIVGSAVGGLLGGLGPLVPLWTTPFLLLAAVLLVATRFRALPVSAEEAALPPPAVRILDRRVLPYLLVSFGLFTALGFMQILVGFLVQDRLGLDVEATAFWTGVALLCAGVGLLLAQVLIVPRAGWGPRRLILAGALVGLLGFLLVVPSGGLPLLLAAVLCIGLGIGLASPGIAAGASLGVGDDEQGAVAGLVAATNSLTFVVAPTAATVLYTLDPVLPLLVAAGWAAMVLLLALLHPVLRPRAGLRGSGP